MAASLSPYLSFNGNCAEAFAFYKEALGGDGTLDVMTHANSPMAEGTPPEMRDKVMHARLANESITLMGSDIPPLRYSKPSPMIQLALSVTPEDRAEAIFAALSAGGTVFLPMQETFWATRFGMLADKFGVSWMVSCEKPTTI